MRSFALVLLAAAAFALPPELVDGKLTDKTWNYTYEVQGLERAAADLAAGPSVLFDGRAAGGVQIQIVLLEGAEKRDAKGWMERAVEAWKKKERKLGDVEAHADASPPWVMFTETKLDVFTEQHGYAFHPRGTQCFVLHAYVADKTDDSAAAIKQALQGLKLGDDPGASLYAMRIAQQSGKTIDDPGVQFGAGMAYIRQGQAQGQEPNYPMAAQCFKKARAAMKEDSFNAEQLWALYEFGGLSHLSEPNRHPKKAIDWHGKAEEAAKSLTDEQGRAQRQAQSAYNLACAYSLDGQVEKGFEALHRAFSEILAVDKGHLTKDTDLDNLKKNQELWDKFWKEKVEGR